MKLQELSKNKLKKSKRLGRGPGSGRGKTAGRGTKGQKARAGHNIPRRFEGGQSPLIMRQPKKVGFRSFNEKPVSINLVLVEKYFSDGEIVSPKTLFERGLIESKKLSVKILGMGKITKNVKFRNCAMSESVKEQIKK